MARNLVLTGLMCVAIATACNIESHEGDITESCDEDRHTTDAGTSGSAGDSSGGAAGSTAGGAGGSAGAVALVCEDLVTESACADRSDCEPIYAGVDCSCGPDCTCVGGQPGCLCTSFEFFECVTAEAP